MFEHLCRVTKKSLFPRIYVFYTQTLLHSYKHTYIHTVLHSYKYVSVYLSFLFIIKSSLIYHCVYCYIVRAMSLLKSMHFLVVVSRSSACKWARVHHSDHLSWDELSMGANQTVFIHDTPTNHSELFANAFWPESWCVRVWGIALDFSRSALSSFEYFCVRVAHLLIRLPITLKSWFFDPIDNLLSTRVKFHIFCSNLASWN